MKVEKGISQDGKRQAWQYYKKSYGIFSIVITVLFAVVGAGIGGAIGMSMVGGGEKKDPEPGHGHGQGHAHTQGGGSGVGGHHGASGTPEENEDAGGNKMVKGIVATIFGLGGAGIGVALSVMCYKQTRLMVLTEDLIRLDEDNDAKCCLCIPCNHNKEALIHSMRDLMWWAGQHGPPAGLVWYVERAPFFCVFFLLLGVFLISEQMEDIGVIFVVLAVVSIALAIFILKCVRSFHLRFGMQPPLGPFHEFSMCNQLGVTDDLQFDIFSPSASANGNDLSCATAFMNTHVMKHHAPTVDLKEAPKLKLNLSQTIPGLSCFAYKNVVIEVFERHSNFITEKKVWWLPCCGLPLSVEKRTVLHESITSMRVYRAGARSIYAVSWLIATAVNMLLAITAGLGGEEPNIGVFLVFFIAALLCFACAAYYLMDIIYKIHNVKLTYAHVISEMFRVTNGPLQEFEDIFVPLVGRVCGSGSQKTEEVAKTFPKNRWCCYSEILKDNSAGSMGLIGYLCCCVGMCWNCPASTCVCSDENFAITTYRFHLTFTQKWLGCMTCGSIQNTFFYNAVTGMEGHHGWKFPACCKCCCQNTCLKLCPCLPRSMFGIEQLWGDTFEAGLRSDTWEDIFEIAGTVSAKFSHSRCHNYSPIGEAVLVGAPVQ